MTPKEKAEWLFNTYLDLLPKQEFLSKEKTKKMFTPMIKKYLLVTVNEIINICPAADIGLYALKDEGDTTFLDYWEQVKEEIIKL